MCDWPVDYTACGPCTALEEFDVDGRADFERFAGELLWRWTGQRFGQCQAVIRPCGSDSRQAARWRSTFWGLGPYPESGAWLPVLVDGEWATLGCGCVGDCGCAVSGAEVLRLPGAHGSVDEVKVDGQTVDPGKYRVAYGNLLVRTDGGVWPAVQDLLVADSEVGTFSVAYTRGSEVPHGGKIAAGVLACELAKAACGDSDCQLPQRVQTITRQGVTVGFQDNFEDLKEGHTGVWMVDSWVASVNAPTPVASVRSPDVSARGPLYGA